MTSVIQERMAASKLTQLVMSYVEARRPIEVECPREQSYMTPCVSRDSTLAVSNDGECVGCGAKPSELLKEFRDKHPTAKS